MSGQHDVFELGWALHENCADEDGTPRFLGFFPIEKDALMVLEKMKPGALHDEYKVFVSVSTPEGFYSGRQGETHDELQDYLRDLEKDPDEEGGEDA